MITEYEAILTLRTELEKGVQLAKCRKCDCMRETLDNLVALLPTIGTAETRALASSVNDWARTMEPVQYACLGCAHCYPAVAQNAFSEAFPAVEALPTLDCDLQVRENSWPPVLGEYYVLNPVGSVAVTTLSSVDLAAALAEREPDDLAIVGKTETENIGIDKIIKNIITNPLVQYLIVAGNDPEGHRSGRTLIALAENGVDSERRVLGSPGKRPVLRNVTFGEIQTFRERVQVIDMIGCDNPEQISTRVEELSQNATAPGGGCGCTEQAPVISTVPKIIAPEPSQTVTMDQAGYFVIIPSTRKGVVVVEHYAYDNTLLHIVEGTDARALYATLIANDWVTELSHAAYLGRELARAELSIELGFRYVQGGA